MNEVSHTNARGISITVRMQRPNINAAHGVRGRSEKATIDLASNDVGIQSRSAEILAHLIQHQQVHFLEGQTWHEPPRLLQELHLFRLDLGGGNRDDARRLMHLIFDDANPKSYSPQPQHLARDRQQSLGMTEPDTGLVKLVGALLFA